MFHALGGLGILAGFALVIVGAIFMLIHGFKESPLWGIGMLLFGPVTLAFLILHWAKAKNAFFIQLYGIGFLFAGALVYKINLF